MENSLTKMTPTLGQGRYCFTKKFFCIYLLLMSITAGGCSNNDLVNYSLIFIGSTGTVTRYLSTGEAILIQEKSHQKIVYSRCGAYYKGFLYFVESGILYETDAKTLERTALFNLMELPRNKNKRSKDLTGYVVYVDENVVVVLETIGDSFVRIDKHLKTITEEAILPDLLSANVSVYQNYIYFTDKNYNICCYHNGKIKRLGIKGFLPYVSPDGTKLAYEFSGIFRSIHIFDLTTRQERSVFTSIMGEFTGPIRWSPDGSLLAVKRPSDFTAPDTYVISALPLIKFKDKITRTGGCNWYFE